MSLFFILFKYTICFVGTFGIYIYIVNMIPYYSRNVKHSNAIDAYDNSD